MGKIIDPVRQDGWRQPIFTFVNLKAPDPFGAWALMKGRTPKLTRRLTPRLMMKIRPLSQNFSAIGLGWLLLGTPSAWRSRLMLTAASFIGLGPLFLPDPALGGNDISTSLEAPGWTAQWIGRNNPASVPPLGQQAPAPLLRKEFTLSNSVAKATLRICGLGFYEAFINGRRVGDQVLDPPPTQYCETALSTPAARGGRRNVRRK